jgi:PhoPQ-activated pathogenicity-related protein
MHRALLLPSCAVFLLVVAFQATAEETALDRYVAAPDVVYSWKLARTIKGEGYTTYVLDLTSQTWRSEKDVDRPVWKHWLSIVKPDQVKRKTAFLFIGGGSNRDKMPEQAPARVAELATYTGSVVAELGTVPNQPLFFSDSKEEGRSEDDLIAYTRVKYMATHDPNWLVRLAMVKSGVRAMDAMQEFLASEEGGKLKIDSFVVAGGSKRGWTTWLVGAVDNRVIAIVPLVIDALNSEVITRHHYEAYGFFSPALNDYVRHGLFPHKVGTPEYREILQIEDPYNYRHRPRLNIPKFIINASGDQFFLPDNSQFYYDELPEEKHLRYVPNAKHNLEGSDARESLAAFYEAVLDGTPRPKFTWKKESDGTLRVTVQDKPSEVNLWQATNPNARDFRVDTIGKAYTSTSLAPAADGSYVARVDKPKSGFTAFFVELVFPTGKKYPLKFTTEVSVVPDVLPFKMPTAAK